MICNLNVNLKSYNVKTNTLTPFQDVYGNEKNRQKTRLPVGTTIIFRLVKPTELIAVQTGFWDISSVIVRFPPLTAELVLLQLTVGFGLPSASHTSTKG